VTPARSLAVALLALAVMAGARPGAEAQFPRGLLAGAPGTKAPGEPTCAIETRPLSFGIYDPEANANVDAVAQVIYTCNNQSKKIRIEMTPGVAGTFDRQMSAGTGLDFLNYNIYLDATRQTIWGQGLFGTDVYYEGNPPNGTPVIVPAYGRIPARQSPAPGQYADVVTVRVLF
jgi:spore coat protein U-like protein